MEVLAQWHARAGSAVRTSVTAGRRLIGKNEIDLVAVNNLKKEIVVAEIKLDKSRIRMDDLKRRAGGLLVAYPGYKTEWLGLGIEDVGKYLE